MTSLLIESRTTQSFTDEQVSDEDLELILEAGLAATSAINQQPWYFVVVTNREAVDEIKRSAGGFTPPSGDKASADEIPAQPQGGDMPGGSAKAGLGDSPVAVIIYMNGDTASPNASFDCGLACENMFIAAKALGYGSKIVSSPTLQLNGDDHDALCAKLGVDKTYTAVAVLLIGHEEHSVDSTSGASVRNTIEEKVSFMK
ncbi:MAG: nitroreductase family protein [Clostridia bacterium]|nr:nitroreductase family protein [Clostridia bacterium]MBQ8962852.1 nitroreductase family protein [Clostridia bacterium]